MLREIACDESGSEGEKLVGGNTDVFAHAGVSLGRETAADCVRQIRERIGSPAMEYKANHLLREKNRWVLDWLLEPTGPVHGSAHVFILDKSYFLLTQLTIALLGENLAGILCRDAPSAFGSEWWAAFLESANDLLRINNRLAAETRVAEAFYELVGQSHVDGRLAGVVERLRRSAPAAHALRAHLRDDPAAVPLLDPMSPAIIRAVDFWSAGQHRISLVHDEQPALTPTRVAHLRSACPMLATLQLVDSRSDPRVQVADFLAGVARKIASDELNGRGDRELAELLRPFVDSMSVWR